MNPIQEIRKASGMSQAAFADALGVTQSTVSQYERGVIRIDIDRAIKAVELARKYGQEIGLDDIYRPEIKEVAHD